MKPATNPSPRSPLSEFTQTLSKQMLHLRLYREGSGFLCERELVESDGSDFTQALPFQSINQVEEFLLADPHYPQIKRGVNKLLGSLALEVWHERASSES